MFKRLLISVFVVLYLSGLTARVSAFSDDFDDGILAPWVDLVQTTYGAPVGPAIAESGGVIHVSSGYWALSPDVGSIIPFKMSVEVDFQGWPWLEMYVRTDGVQAGPYHSPRGLRLDYWNGTIGVDDWNSGFGTFFASQVRALNGFTGGKYIYEVDDQGTTIICKIIDPGNPANFAQTNITGITPGQGYGSQFCLGVDPGGSGWPTLKTITYDNFTVEEPGFKITETGGDTVINEEGESSDSFTVALLTEPGSEVTVSVAPAANDVKVNGAAAGATVDLIFTTGNWDSPQTVTVQALDDNVYERDGTFINRNKPYITIINFSAASSDNNFNGLSQVFYVDVMDNEVYDGPLRSCDTKIVGFKYSSSDAFQYEKITHIIYAFVNIIAAGNISGPDLRSFAADAHQYGVKAIASVVGDFASMTDNADGSRDAFIANAVQYLINNNLDGIDYDWENAGFNSTERNNYSLLVRDTSIAFEPYGFTVSIDVVTWRNEIDNWAIEYLDWLNLMGYDAGPPDHTSFQDHLDVINVWESRGAPRKKLVAGTGFYGWKGNWLGSYEYYLIRQYWDPGPEVNMIFLPDGNVGFCGINTTQQKMQHVIDNGYGGIMIWNLAHDTRDDDSLLKALHNVKDYYSVPCDSDIDDTNNVNLVDFSLLATRWENGMADLIDLYEFLRDWLSLTGFWRFDESAGTTAGDSSGNNRDGTLVNMEAGDWVAAGAGPGNALEFDGVDEYVEITGYKGVTGPAPRTVAAWIKTGVIGEIIGWGHPGSAKGWLVFLNPSAGSGVVGALRVAVWGGTITGSTDLRDNQWHHVAVVLPDNRPAQTGELKLYVDGVRETLSSLVNAPFDTDPSNNVTIGVFHDLSRATLNYFNGQLDDVRVYNRGLTGGEIWELAN